jgi:hypothetical protein
MLKNKPFLSILLVLVLSTTLAACSSLPLTQLPLLPQAQTSDPAKMAVVNKLGVGILKMEGTSQAVTTNQASALLPLWKAVYKMGNDKNASGAEVTALYEQIQETLSADQVKTIQQFTWTQQELSELMQKYGSAPVGQTASSASSTTSTSRSSQGGFGGPPDMGGMPGGGPMGDITSVGGNSGSSSSTTNAKSGSTTTRASQSSSSNLNPMFASAVINILKKRVALE